MNEIEHDLWISDIRDIEVGDTSRFDRVISVCQDSREDNVACDYYHFKLADGPPHPRAKNPGECSYDLFEEAVDTIIEGLEAGETILVHCHAGRSRSVMSTVAALAVYNEEGFDETFWKVKSRNGQAQPADKIYLFAQQYVNRRLYDR